MASQLFRAQVKARSDFAVRDWLNAHQVPLRQGRPTWAVSTSRNLLCNRRAQELQLQREQLQAEQQRLIQELRPLENHFYAAAFRSVLRNFAGLLASAEPEERQQLLRLLARRVDWRPDGRHLVQFYTLPLPPRVGGKVGFELNVRSATPRGI